MPSDTARRLHREHLARQRRMTARAVPDAGINMHNGRPVAIVVRGLASLSGPVTGRFMRRWQFPFAAGILKLGLSLGTWRSLSIEQIVRAVCRHYHVTRTDLMSQRRDARTVRPRHVAMYLARELTGQTFPMIARAFGDRDHTTVLHAARVIEAQLVHDANLITEVRTLKYRLGAI